MLQLEQKRNAMASTSTRKKAVAGVCLAAGLFGAMALYNQEGGSAGEVKTKSTSIVSVEEPPRAGNSVTVNNVRTHHVRRLQDDTSVQSRSSSKTGKSTTSTKSGKSGATLSVSVHENVLPSPCVHLYE